MHVSNKRKQLKHKRDSSKTNDCCDKENKGKRRNCADCCRLTFIFDGNDTSWQQLVPLASSPCSNFLELELCFRTTRLMGHWVRCCQTLMWHRSRDHWVRCYQTTMSHHSRDHWVRCRQTPMWHHSRRGQNHQSHLQTEYSYQRLLHCCQTTGRRRVLLCCRSSTTSHQSRVWENWTNSLRKSDRMSTVACPAELRRRIGRCVLAKSMILH